MRARYIVLGLLVGGAVVMCWTSVAAAGGWAEADRYITEGTITFRNLIKFVLIGACAAAGCYFFATSGLSMTGLGAMFGIGLFSVFLVTIMFPMIDSMGTGATLDDVHGRLPGTSQTIVTQDAALGPCAREANGGNDPADDGRGDDLTVREGDLPGDCRLLRAAEGD